MGKRNKYNLAITNTMFTPKKEKRKIRNSDEWRRRDTKPDRLPNDRWKRKLGKENRRKGAIKYKPNVPT